MDTGLERRLAAEVIGTAILVLFGAGSVIAALTLGAGKLDYAGLGMISISFAIAVAVPIYAFGETSGAHINPAVTLALAATGRFPRREVIPYIGAQLLGAFVGALLIVAMFGSHVVHLGAGAGGTALGPHTSYLQGIVAEGLATFLLMTTIMALAVDRRAPGGWAGLMIGLAVAGEILVVGPLTGGAINPARAFGPLLATTLWGGKTNWGDYPVYIIGPVLGAIVAALLYDFVARPTEGEATDTGSPQGQGTQGEVLGHPDVDASIAGDGTHGRAGEIAEPSA